MRAKLLENPEFYKASDAPLYCGPLQFLAGSFDNPFDLKSAQIPGARPDESVCLRIH